MNPILRVYLPEPVICSVLKNGQLYQKYKAALPQTLEGLASVTYKGTPHEQLLAIAAELSEEQLSIKFKPKGKRKVNFTTIAEDDTVLELFKRHVSRKVAKMLSICKEEGYTVTLDLLRKESAEEFTFPFATQEYIPRLKFDKNAEGIDYTLYFEKHDKKVFPFDTNTIILTNQPSWVVMHNEIIHLEQLNGNKLKPFLRKIAIHIPQRSTKMYFEKFIMDLVPKVSIETLGFEIIDNAQLDHWDMELVESVFQQQHLLRPVFHYQHFSFKAGDRRESKTMINFSDSAETVTIINQLRDHEEEKRITDGLLGLGGKITDSGYLLIGAGGLSETIGWMAAEKNILQKLGLRLEGGLAAGERKLSLKEHAIDVNVENGNDWFDVGGYVTIGEQQIPFISLIQNIKNNDPYFLLSDDSFFVIPAEWMTKYGSIAKFGNKVDGRLQLAKNQYGLLEDIIETKDKNLTPIALEKKKIEYKPSAKLKAKLRSYQHAGVEWLLHHQAQGLGACLADDMGLGKTLQVIAALVHTADQLTDNSQPDSTEGQMSMFDIGYAHTSNPLKALVIVPASLVHNWLSELQKFAPHLKATSYIGTKRKERRKLLGIYDVVITTYQTALRDIDILHKETWTYVILDESQYIKNRNSKIFSALSGLNAEHKISLSGTPIENSLSDLWSQMQFINPDILGSFEFFKKHFKIPIEKNRHEASLLELRKIVAPFLLRRTKGEVLKDLPPVVQQNIVVPMSVEQKKLFEERKSAARNNLLALDDKQSGYKIHVFKELMALRQIANHPELVQEDYDGGSGKYEMMLEKLRLLIKAEHRVLVFSSFTSLLELISRDLENEGVSHLSLTGSDSHSARKRAVTDFQGGNFSVFLISIKAGGVGLNLTQADYVFILDPWWNPFVEEQAIARAHRMGQKNSVTVLRYISQDSIEEKIQILQAKKRQLNADIISDESVGGIGEEDLAYLLE